MGLNGSGVSGRITIPAPPIRYCNIEVLRTRKETVAPQRDESRCSYLRTIVYISISSFVLCKLGPQPFALQTLDRKSVV